jgi:glycosyltransferase involved in cell wall biosynthesis
MIDMHILISRDTPELWVDHSLDMAMRAVALSPVPVIFHVIDGEPGHIGRARARGYARGSSPYVTFVDDDDWLEPDAFAGVADLLAEGVPAILPLEWVWQNGQQSKGTVHGHHLPIFRRELLIDHAAWQCCGDVAQLVKLNAATGSVLCGKRRYNHRLYASSKARALRRRNMKELRCAHGF